MVVGFVNAGIMTLKQSVGVILGANIGTTITAQILRLSGGEGSGNLFMDLLKPKNLAYIIVLVGVIIMMIAKSAYPRYRGYLHRFRYSVHRHVGHGGRGCTAG